MEQKREKIILCLWLVCIFVIVFPISAVFADGTNTLREDEIQYVVPTGVTDKKKAIIEFKLTDNTAFFFGRHARSDSPISYWTVGYNISLYPCTGGNVTALGDKRDRINLNGPPVDDIKEEENMVHTTYNLNRDKLIEKVRDLLMEKYNNDVKKVNEEFNKGVDVYFNNIFRVYKRVSGSGTFQPSEKDFISGELHNKSDFLANQSWGDGTRAVIPYYYNIQLKIYISQKNSYDVIYVDTNGKELKKAETKQPIYKMAKLEYTVPANIMKDGLTVGGKLYKFNNKAEYIYQDGKSTTVTVKNDVLSLTHIEAQDADLKVIFTPSYTYNVAYVDIKGNVIANVQTGNAVFKDDKAAFTIPPDVLKNGTTINGVLYWFNRTGSYMYHGEDTKYSVVVEDEKLSTTHKKDTDATLRAVFITKVPTPTPVISRTPTPTPYQVKTQVSKKYMETNAAGKIASDARGAERFDVLQGIPTTEALYGEVKASEYLYDVTFNKIEGTINYTVSVEKPYLLTWEETDPMGNTISKSEEKSAYGVVNISRKYSYYELAELTYYQLSDAVLKNYALPDGELTLIPKNYSIPDISYQHYDGIDAHIKKPPQVSETIKLSAGTGNTSTPPIFNPNEFQTEVDALVAQLEVRNDAFTFDGAAVLTDSYATINAPAVNLTVIKDPGITKDNVLYASGLIIDAKKNNGIHKTTGTLSYTQVKNFRSSSGNSKTQLLQDLNSVTIHTPVYCLGQLINDNKKYVQLINPEPNAVPVVLDTESFSSDFIVQISNEGYHTSKPGYGTRDYKKYVLKNQVKFPFDVYLDVGNDSKDTNDTLLPANTWYTVTNSQRFHVPMWVKEDLYTGILFRSIAINGEGKESLSEINTNATLTNYAAWDSKWVQVSGKVYGLALYDINDELWKPVFRKYQSLSLKRNLGGADGTLTGKTYNRDYIYDYTVGTNNQYGLSSTRSSRYTFPLIAGSHPHEINQGVSKAGYVWRFTLQTTGSEMMADASYIKIKPRFFYIDKNGSNREEVDLYYSGKINGVQKNMVKVGSELDDKNVKTVQTNNIDLAIPESELKLTAAIRSKTYTDWLKQKNTMYTYGMIQTKLAFKTFSNSAYTAAIRKRPSASAVKTEDNDISRRKQSYYFNYSLPNSFKAVKKGTDLSGYKTITYKEPFWKKNGYILINFEITCYDKNGTAYLSYINGSNYLNGGYGSMWVLEGAPASKTDHYGKTFRFMAGDTLMMDTDKTSYDDYKAGGIY